MKTLLRPSMFYFFMSIFADVLLSVPAMALFAEQLPDEMDALEDDDKEEPAFSRYQVDNLASGAH